MLWREWRQEDVEHEVELRGGRGRPLRRQHGSLAQCAVHNSVMAVEASVPLGGSHSRKAVPT